MPKSTSLRVVLVIAASSIAACVLYPAVWHIIQMMYGESFGYEPEKVFKRIWMIAVVTGLIVARSHIGLQNPSSAGFSTRKDSIVNAVLGVLVAWGFLFVMAAVYSLMDQWGPSDRNELPRLLKKFYGGFIRGSLVAFIEEYIFRGLIFLSFCKRFGWMTAAAFSSLIFSSLHFLDAPGMEWEGNADALYAGFLICGDMLKQMVIGFDPFPSAFGLFIIGWVLCYALHKTGSLWYGIGLHGGWVWFASFRSSIFHIIEDADRFWVGGARLYDGVIPVIGLFVIFPITYLLLRTKLLYVEDEATNN